ncbi:MAG TPA: SdiA-regulated domain-containing protein [Gemmatimonadaceae bacterium]|nr:SdiA-regulated domain-containing protein [Gemmatimonadaceae bacterium]
MSASLRILLLAGLAAFGGCRPATPGSLSGELAARELRLATNFASARADSPRTRVLARWILPRELGEVSGLALTGDGRLLAHGDEQGAVFVIDARRGAVLKRFSIGTFDGDARADFEGITVAEGRIVMLASDGRLHEFLEGAAGERVRFDVHDTRLATECEFEGVAYDATRQLFLLPCKSVGRPGLRDQLVLYRWRLRGTGDPGLAPLAIPLSRVIGSNPWKDLHPSDITVDPASGNYVLIAAQERALIEITPSGEVVRAMALPGTHGQAEGVALTPEGILIVADEATNRPATLTLYRWPLTVAAREPP